VIFNSHIFVVFFAIVLSLYWVAPARFRNHLLLAASYIFYGWWNWRFLFLLVASSVIDFTLAKTVHRTADERRRLALLWMSVMVNLGFLGVFKYTNFFIDSFETAMGSLGFDVSGPTLDIVLPVGISFYTFQTISYTFDVYRRRIEPTDRLLDFATYVAYFPQLVAGPIERAKRLLPRIEEQAARVFPRGRALERALSLILVGLFKKVVLADGVAPVVNDVFGDPDGHSWIAVAAGVIGFAIQIYGDFSGYTDMARGVSELLGISLVVNFREPYLSRNITEFWRRWHISLSDWLRDYLYIPLGGNRGSQLVTGRNLMLTMLLGGLWHGASFNFVIWGLLHGLFLAFHRWVLGGDVPDAAVRWREWPNVLVTFVVVNIAWIFFRAETLADSFGVIRGLFRFTSGRLEWSDVLLVAALFAVMVAIDFVQRRMAVGQIEGAVERRLPSPALGAAAAAMILSIVMFSGGSPQPFIYFQF